MQLEKLEIENYKLFDHVAFTPSKATTLLIGTNGSGKSALLQVFRLLGGLAHGSDFRTMRMWFSLFAREGFIGCPPEHDKSKIMTFRINAADERAEYRYTLALGAGSDEQPRITEEELVINETSWIQWDAGQAQWTFKDGEILARGYDYPLVLNSSTERFILQKYETERELVQRFIHWVAGWEEYAPETMDAGKHIENMVTTKHQMLAHRGENYPPVLLNWKNGRDKDRWEFVHEYTNTLLSVLNLDLKWDLIAKPSGNLYAAESRLYPATDKSATGYDLAFGPDGLKQWLIILTAVCSPHISLLTLEEPEQHIDPRIIDLLVEAIQAAVEQWPRQIVLTTQSPIFASHWPIESIRLIKNGTINSVSENFREDIQEKRLQLLDAWLMDMLIGEFQT